MKEFDLLMRKFYEYVYRTNERFIYYFTVFPFERKITEEISSLNAINIDFHTHTGLGSDGVHTPSYNAWKGYRRKLDGIAETDHDTVIHYPYCEHIQKKFIEKDFLVIPGIEYTTTIRRKNDMVGTAHIVGLSPSYKPSKKILKLVKRTQEIKKPQNFLRYTLNLGNKDLLPSEEVTETLEDENNVVIFVHPWSNLGVQDKLKYLLEKQKQACVEVYNPRANITFPDGVPHYVIEHGHLIGSSDTHMARLTIGDASTLFHESDVYGLSGRPELEKVYEAMREGKTKPYLAKFSPLVLNSDKWRFAHVLHGLRSFVGYLDDEERIWGRITNEVLAGNEIENIENHRVLPIYNR